MKENDFLILLMAIPLFVAVVFLLCNLTVMVLK